MTSAGRDLSSLPVADGRPAIELQVHAGTGEIVWRTPVCRQITSTAAIDGPVIYVGGNDATMTCVDRESGEVSWRFATGGAVVAKPLVTHDHIIFGSLDGSVRALNRAF